jgi:hypothetical protein
MPEQAYKAAPKAGNDKYYARLILEYSQIGCGMKADLDSLLALTREEPRCSMHFPRLLICILLTI